MNIPYAVDHPSVIVNKFGFATERKMPEVQSQDALKEIYNSQPLSEKKVILFADTFNINFENKNLVYTIKVLNKFGYQALIPSYGNDKLSRPLCCGRGASAGGFDQIHNGRGFPRPARADD